MKHLTLKLLTLLMMTTMLAVPVVYAKSTSDILANPACSYIKAAGGQLSGCTSGETVNTGHGLAYQIVNTLLFAAGIIAFVFILIGGFRYITSTGDSARIQAAKDTLLYAVIGLILTFMAVPIADFIIAKVSGG